MKILVPVPEEQYMDRLRSKLDHSHSVGKEKFKGFCGSKYFYISYQSGDAQGTFGASVFNTAIGCVKEEDSQTMVSYNQFYGLTYPVNFLLLFILSCLLFVLVRIPNPMMFGFWTALGGALFTFLCSFLTGSGKRGAKSLDKLFTHLFPQYM